MASKNILITGALGYLGSVIVPYLQERGYHCRGIDAGFFKDCLLFDPIPFHCAIGRVEDLTEDDLRSIDAVVHLAGISNDPFGNLSAMEVYDPTRDYTKRLALWCKKLGIRFIFASSCSVYGYAKEVVDELSVPQPQTPYSVNKLQIEEDLREMSDEHFHPIMLRFATAFGSSPRMRFDIVINMLTGMGVVNHEITLNSDGKAWRPFTHVLDIAQSVACALVAPEPDMPLILNVGDNANNAQILDIVQLIQRRIPACKVSFLNASSDRSAELIHDRKVQDGHDTRSYQVSFDRIQSVWPAYAPTWTIDRGIAEMIEGFHTVGLTKAMFENPNFYRLQKMEQLFKEKRL